MPVFVEEASNLRDSRVNPPHITPLPRLSPAAPSPNDVNERYEVVVVGSGPAGIMTAVLLARYGITSVLTVDEKPQQQHSGQADGIQPRTLEVLQSLDLAHEVISQGCLLFEVGFWNPSADGVGIVRTSFVTDVIVPTRYPHELTIHQGRMERILNEDLKRNGNAVQRDWRVEGWVFDYADEEFPVCVRMRGGDGRERVVRTKYLVGADGAHSVVREGMGLKLVGDHTDHVWGVMDAVVTTDFPDIRKRCAIHSNAGSIMIIPRERVSGGKVLSRIYCQMEDEIERDPALTSNTPADAKSRRQKVSLERIIAQTKRVISPYTIDFGDFDWWAAYQIGQRIAPKFSLADAHGILRVHIAGDACHTHSPKAGQGMNVSMMDGFNLSWKLAHVLTGLASNPTSLLATYELERLEIARQLIEFDTKFSSMFSGRIGDTESGLTHDEFVAVFRAGGGFTSGCGIQYGPGLLVGAHDESATVITAGPTTDSGHLIPGRRVLNVKTVRFADASPRDIHDDMPSTGQYRIVVLLPTRFKSAPETGAAVMTYYVSTLQRDFAQGALETVVVFPGTRGALEWTDFPVCVREMSEWLVLGDHSGETYKTWGVDEAKGALVVVRPDGYVGVVAALEEASEGVVGYLRGVLRGVLRRGFTL